MPSSACKKCALRSEEHTSELQSHDNLVCRLLLEKITEQAQVLYKVSDKNVGSAQDPARAQERRLCPRRAARAPPPGPERPGSAPFFFFKNRGPPEFHPFPLPGPLRY